MIRTMRLAVGLVAVCLMIYYVLAMQCMSTIAVVRRETNVRSYTVRCARRSRENSVQRNASDRQFVLQFDR